MNAYDGGARIEDEDHTIGHTTREYFYDGLRRLRTVVLERPGSSANDYDEVTITVHYDHRARPYRVTVTNEDTDVTEENRYYYDLEDRVITWLRTPDTGTATTYEARQYVHIGEFAVGEMARSWVSGSATRHTYFHTTEPLGLETGAFEFEHSGGASVSYNPSTVVRQWTAFGRPLVATGSGVALPTRFPGQLELRGSDVRIWDDSVVVAHRDGLYLNRWRVYDPRVGQYLQPDPEAIQATLLGQGPFSYSGVMPGDRVDADGRVPWWWWVDWFCRAFPGACWEPPGPADDGGGGGGEPPDFPGGPEFPRPGGGMCRDGGDDPPGGTGDPVSCAFECENTCEGLGEPEFEICYWACMDRCLNDLPPQKPERPTLLVLGGRGEWAKHLPVEGPHYDHLARCATDYEKAYATARGHHLTRVLHILGGDRRIIAEVHVLAGRNGWSVDRMDEELRRRLPFDSLPAALEFAAPPRVR